jgi:hypothetical protein
MEAGLGRELKGDTGCRAIDARYRLPLRMLA